MYKQKCFTIKYRDFEEQHILAQTEEEALEIYKQQIWEDNPDAILIEREK
jgi:hypothetical protein